MSLMRGETVSIDNYDLVRKLITYCLSIAGDYEFTVKISKHGSVKLKMEL